MEEFGKLEERVVLVGVQTDDHDNVEESLDELKELASTAGAVTVGRIIQNRESVHPGTYIGKGKIEEVRALVYAMDATGIICDDELSPAQLNNLERELDCKVMDRTLLILDIFAARAITSEGKIQVELAQLRYRSARLVGLRESLSRLGGGIGTRGPGEKKLETDRRLIRTRISALKQELSQVEKHRELIRSSRARGNMKTAAIVGYTNAGKSTLLNTLTGSEVLSEDKLFATLDPTTRLLNLKDGQQILLTDTVGFIHKLPHHLVEAFKSTLEEAKYADYIIHVVDSSNPQAEMQMHVVYETLKELGAMGKKIITLFNKQDAPGACVLRDFKSDYTLKVSAKTGEGLADLNDLLEKLLAEEQIYVERLFPYQEAGKIQLENPTIEGFAKVFEDVKYVKESEDNELVRLNFVRNGNDNKIIVLYPDGINSLSQYNGLINKIQEEFGSYTIIGVNLCENQVFFETAPECLIPDIGKVIAQKLMQAYSKCEIVLIGYCIGGLMAIETGRFLLEQGKNVNGIVTIDTRTCSRCIDNDLIMEMIFKIILNGGEQDKLMDQQISDAVRAVLTDKKSAITNEELCNCGEQFSEVNKYFTELCTLSPKQRFDSLLDYQKIELDEERNRILNLYRMFRHNYRGVMNYAQDFYIGDVLALQCNDNTGFFLPAEMIFDSDFLQQTVLGNLSYEAIPGNHLTCLDNNNIPLIYGYIRKYLS